PHCSSARIPAPVGYSHTAGCSRRTCNSICASCSNGLCAAYSVVGGAFVCQFDNRRYPHPNPVDTNRCLVDDLHSSRNMDYPATETGNYTCFRLPCRCCFDCHSAASHALSKRLP